MLMLPSGVNIWVAVEPINMKKSFDGLAALVQGVLAQDALSGHLLRIPLKMNVDYYDRER